MPAYRAFGSAMKAMNVTAEAQSIAEGDADGVSATSPCKSSPSVWPRPLTGFFPLLPALLSSSCCLLQLALNTFSIGCAGFARLTPYKCVRPLRVSCVGHPPVTSTAFVLQQLMRTGQRRRASSPLPTASFLSAVLTCRLCKLDAQPGSVSVRLQAVPVGADGSVSGGNAAATRRHPAHRGGHAVGAARGRLGGGAVGPQCRYQPQAARGCGLVTTSGVDNPLEVPALKGMHHLGNLTRTRRE